MATFDITPLFRSTAVGFDRALDQLNTAVHLDQTGYPPYNILRTGEEDYRISLAVPGYRIEDITIESKEGSVWVRGEKKVDEAHNQYLYRSIPSDGFQRTFQLPDYVRVQEARLESGMLHIELVRELPEALRPKRISIVAADERPAKLEDSSRAA